MRSIVWVNPKDRPKAPSFNIIPVPQCWFEDDQGEWFYDENDEHMNVKPEDETVKRSEV